MSEKVCLIRQPAGIGDIFFCQKISHIFNTLGYKVYWPVIEPYYEAIMRHMSSNNVVYCREGEEFPMKEYYHSSIAIPTKTNQGANIYLPLQYSDLTNPNESVMYSKYKNLNISFEDWMDYLTIERNHGREDYLYYDVLSLDDDTDYVVSNRFFGSPPDILERGDMRVPPNVRNVDVKMFGFDTIFDWCKVFEKAKEIHTVETSFCYLIEYLKLLGTKKVLYSRNKPDRGFDYISKIFSSGWEYVP